MSYYIRYVLTDDKEVTVPGLEKALQQVNPGYLVDEDTLVLGDDEYGQIEINAVGDGIFEGDIELLEGFAEEKETKETLLTTLQAAKSMVTVQPIWKDRDDEETLNVLKPLFDWLLANRAGLLAVEGGSFFNSDGPLA